MDLEHDVVVLGKEVLEKSLKLEEIRFKTALNLQSEIETLLKEVGLKNAKLEIQVGRLTSGSSIKEDKEKFYYNSRGINEIQFMISTNEGIPVGPLSNVASGGEISRVMLAIKASLASKANLSTMIFDEIDTGISGEVAMKVGILMQKMSQNLQLICITHLPQIASKGQNHFFIYKESKSGKTVSRIKVLKTEDRILEIAKMTSGENPPQAALDNAKNLLGL